MFRKFAVTAALWAAIALAPGPAAAQGVTHPWEGAQALVKTVEADIKAGGLKSVGAHTADLEAALAEGQKLPPEGVVDGDTRYVLTDGQAQTVRALIGAALIKDGAVRDTRAIATPYPAVGFYLGSYYNEVGRFDEALKTLDVGLALDGETPPGRLRAVLISERGAALAGLKRWADILANGEDGLKLPDLPDRYQARLHRGRGFALVELGRLDEAQAAYELSLKLEPSNPVAARELQYISRLRAGGAPTAVQLTLPGGQPR